MRAVREEIVEPRFQLRHGIGPGNAEDVKSARARLFRKGSLDRRRLGQKSRSA